MVRTVGLRLLAAARLYPHINFTYSPFKILEFEALTAGVNWRGDERVLDLGCGTGLHSFLIGRRCREIVGVDIDPLVIEQARWMARNLRRRVKAEFVAGALEHAGLAPASFDYAFSICVLEHISNYREVLSEILRLLRPGGRLLISVDALESITEPSLREAHRVAHQVAVYFSRSDLAQTLTELGFTDVTVRPLFRSATAGALFRQGIERGFNFGRLRAPILAHRLRVAEASAAESAPCLFLMASARRS